MTQSDTPSIHDDDAMAALIEIMRRLRAPDGGCPWDLEQTFETIAPYTIEEAYEVAEAIREGDREDLKDELGDLLFQVVYHARMAEEEGSFAFEDVARAIAAKMIRRHPHVFGDSEIASAEEQTLAWEEMKARERAQTGKKEKVPSALDGVPLALPALTRSVKLQKRASRVGFDWRDGAKVIGKVREEIEELAEAVEEEDRAHMEEELGDFLFVCANLARHLDIDPEAALAAANAKFVRRFSGVERLLSEMGKTPKESDLEEMNALWERVKKDERESKK